MSEAWSTFSDYETALTSSPSDHEMYQEKLISQIEALYTEIAFSLEAMNLPQLSSDFRAGFERYRENAAVLLTTPLGDLFPPALVYLADFVRPLATAIGRDHGATGGLLQLEQILRNTPKIIKDRRIDPKNEGEVRNAVYDVLACLYPDTARDVPIAKVNKRYKPDIGIRSLKAAIEYKFVDSEEDAHRAIGGIYEDVKGYAGSEDWKHFYAVFYMTDAFLTQEQVEAEFSLSTVEHSWQPIVVIGRGQRKTPKEQRSGVKKGVRAAKKRGG